VSPVENETIESNLASTRRYLRALHRAGIAAAAPWYPEVLIYDDSAPEEREAGLQRDCAVAKLFPMIITVGSRLSSGMKREVDAVESVGGRWINLCGHTPQEVGEGRLLGWVVDKVCQGDFDRLCRNNNAASGSLVQLGKEK
jgi:hypothetical protein